MNILSDYQYLSGSLAHTVTAGPVSVRHDNMMMSMVTTLG